MKHLTFLGMTAFLLSACMPFPAVFNELTAPARSKNSNPARSYSPDVDDIEPDPQTELPTVNNLFDFTGNEPGWYSLNDDVMGGVSTSKVEYSNPGVLAFSGNLSLDNNGGFTSIRSEWREINLSNSDGILLRVLGDGKLYRLRIRSAATGADVSYNAFFETRAGEWQEVYIPFDEMVPTYRGFLVDTGKLDTSRIGSFGFMLSEKQTGDFSLLIDWIQAVPRDDIQFLNAYNSPG
jgi:monofunctional biosynthetic peptidoglycan transglycosylase